MSLNLSFLGITTLFEFVNWCPSLMWGIFLHYFFKCFSPAVISFSAPSGILKTHVRCLPKFLRFPPAWHTHTHPNLFFLYSLNWMISVALSSSSWSLSLVICFLLLSLSILSQISGIFFSSKVFNLFIDIVSAFQLRHSIFPSSEVCLTLPYMTSHNNHFKISVW